MSGGPDVAGDLGEGDGCHDEGGDPHVLEKLVDTMVMSYGVLKGDLDAVLCCGRSNKMSSSRGHATPLLGVTTILVFVALLTTILISSCILGSRAR